MNALQNSDLIDVYVGSNWPARACHPTGCTAQPFRCNTQPAYS
jgi:hypothetical protein